MKTDLPCTRCYHSSFDHVTLSCLAGEKGCIICILASFIRTRELKETTQGLSQLQRTEMTMWKRLGGFYEQVIQAGIQIVVNEDGKEVVQEVVNESGKEAVAIENGKEKVVNSPNGTA
jgi:hypothetical protein